MSKGIVSKNNTPIEETSAYKLGTTIAEVLLYTHIALMIFFFVARAPIMVGVNVVSVICYYLEKNHILKVSPSVFLDVLVGEILIHMMLAVYFTGWDMGFQYYAFCLGPIIFFTDHALKRDGFDSAHPVVFGCLTVLAFLVCRFFCLRGLQFYEVKDSMVDAIHTVNGVAVLVVLWVFPKVYIGSILEIEKALVQTAQYDELTGLPNRHQLDQVLKERKVGQLDGDKEYAVAIFDLDDFKKVNDRFGHLAGDQVLKNMAAILKHSENDDVFVGRWGGEEFVALVKGDDAYARTMNLAEEIRLQVENSIVFFEHWQLRITVSVGCTGTKKGKKFTTLVEEADTYLYEAKGNGKNQVVGKWGFK